MNKDYLINTKQCLRREGLGTASYSREDHRRRGDGPTAGTSTSQCPPLSSLPPHPAPGSLAQTRQLFLPPSDGLSTLEPRQVWQLAHRHSTVQATSRHVCHPVCFSKLHQAGLPAWGRQEPVPATSSGTRQPVRLWFPHACPSERLEGETTRAEAHGQGQQPLV